MYSLIRISTLIAFVIMVVYVIVSVVTGPTEQEVINMIDLDLYFLETQAAHKVLPKCILDFYNIPACEELSCYQVDNIMFSWLED